MRSVAICNVTCLNHKTRRNADGVQKMNNLRNLFKGADAYEPPHEAFAYDDDVTQEAVEILRRKADDAMKDGKWKVVEGRKLG